MGACGLDQSTMQEGVNEWALSRVSDVTSSYTK